MSDTISVPSRQDLIMESVTDFFTERNHLHQMMPILNQTAHISLRILDYFVTNYAKKKKIIYQHQDRFFNVFLNYKAQLKAYSKKQFDPFCRKIRKVNGKQINEAINFYYDDGKSIETTVGQLNFFKWAIQNGVLGYIVDHLTDIVEDMILSSKQKKTENKCNKTKKVKDTSPRKTLPEQSITATKTINPNNQKIKVIVDFS